MALGCLFYFRVIFGSLVPYKMLTLIYCNRYFCCHQSVLPFTAVDSLCIIICRLLVAAGCKRRMDIAIDACHPLYEFFSSPPSLQELSRSAVRSLLVRRRLYSQLVDRSNFGVCPKEESKFIAANGAIVICKQSPESPLKNVAHRAFIRNFQLPNVVMNYMCLVHERRAFRLKTVRETIPNLYICLD